MSSSKQTAANIENSKLSTAPRSPEGKQIVSGNAIKHGILSTKLLLEDERIEDYQALLDDLMSQLAPVGMFEQTLMKKISVILWRQTGSD